MDIWRRRTVEKEFWYVMWKGMGRGSRRGSGRGSRRGRWATAAAAAAV